jgi:hypothetical protein
MDVHRSSAQLAIVEGGVCRDEGLSGPCGGPAGLGGDAAAEDEVALEATTKSDAIATTLRPLVARVVVSNPRKTRAIAEAKVKTDNVDARILAQLLAADFLPATWVPDERTRRLRRLVMRRTHFVRHCTRLKNQTHVSWPATWCELSAGRSVLQHGRRWLGKQPMAADERRSVDACCAVAATPSAATLCGSWTLTPALGHGATSTWSTAAR